MSDGRKFTSPINGRLGGVRTDRGKARSAANSTKWGLYTKRPPVLSTESQAAYDELKKCLSDTHKPIGEQETIDVDQLTDVTWSIDRYQAAQHYLIEFEMAAQADDIAALNPDGIPSDMRMALAVHHVLTTEHSAFVQLSLILDRLYRTKERLLRELQKLQGERFNQMPPAPPATEPDHEQQKQEPIQKDEPNPDVSPEESAPPPIPIIPDFDRTGLEFTTFDPSELKSLVRRLINDARAVKERTMSA